MRKLVAEFEVIPADIDEKQFREDSPWARTMAIAKAKGKAVASRVAGPAVIVTADTMVQMPDGTIREKPVSDAELNAWLLSYRDYGIRCVTSVFVLLTPDGSYNWITDTAWIKFRPFEAGRIEDIIADGTAKGCAGGFTMEHPLFADHIEEVRGDPECIQGLPGRRISERLAQWA